MKRIIAWWVHNSVAANLLMAGIVLAGILGMQSMEKEAFPNIKINQASIYVAWPGANPLVPLMVSRERPWGATALGARRPCLMCLRRTVG